MSKKKGEEKCPKCGSKKPLQKHHIYPQSMVKRLYGNDKNAQKNHFYIKLCDGCHSVMHGILLRQDHLTPRKCAELCWKFLMEKEMYL